MKTKVVYILVSQEDDYYYEMLLLSYHSLRHYHPKERTEVVLVMDQDTYNRLIKKRAPILDDITPVIVDIPEEYTVLQRSRYLKTSLRSLVEGDFLYIDSDTIICDRLDEIDSLDADIAMVADLNRRLPLTDNDAIKKCKTAGFEDMEGNPYFNSGVIFAKDSLTATSFFDVWAKNWKRSFENNVVNDQPALCATNREMGEIVQELDGIWNCQYKYEGYKFMSKAKIHHYFGWNFSDFSHFHHNYLFYWIRERGCVDEKVSKLLFGNKSILFTALTIPPEQAFDFYFSESLYLYSHRPKIMRFARKGLTFLTELLYRKRL